MNTAFVMLSEATHPCIHPMPIEHEKLPAGRKNANDLVRFDNSHSPGVELLKPNFLEI